MKRFIFTILLIFACFLGNATRIDVKQTGTYQHGRPSMPLTIKPIVDLENDIITTTVAHYSGPVTITIYNEEGVTVDRAAAEALPDEPLVMDVSGLPAGEYTIEIVLSNIVFQGTFSI